MTAPHTIPARFPVALPDRGGASDGPRGPAASDPEQPGNAATSPETAPAPKCVGGFSGKLRVLVACEYSGRVRNAFRDLGHDARSCDLLDAEDAPTPWHWRDSLEHVIARDQAWDLIIAHPPCTYLCNSGVRWLHERPGRWQQMEEAAEFFRWILDLPVPHIAVENPVMHKYAREIVGRGADFSVQPWQFGDPAKKRTCFWTKNLLPLIATSDLTAADARADCHLASPGPDRWKERSRTYPGLAEAIADQWGAYAMQEATHAR